MIKKTFLSLLFIIGLICHLQTANAQQTLSSQQILNESEAAFNQRMEWWREAKFGMFIHWGAYAVPAGVYHGEEIGGIGEWIMNTASIPVSEYEEYARQFNPVKYDPDRWVQLAKEAGMKYIIITSKHHEGFSLWDSEVSDYDAKDFAAIHKDLLKGLREACDKYGIKLGFYYSIMDWHHPDAQAPKYPDYNSGEKPNPRFDQYVQNYLKPQLKELVQNYDPAILWFDGEWIPEWTHEYAVDIYTMLRKMNPDLIINNRVDVGRQGMQGMNEGDENYVGDFGTPEQEILEDTSDFDWESCMTMNDTWGYKKNDENWKSAEQLIFNLVDVAAKGGNYLLNVGPKATGEIPDASVKRLKEMGKWLDVNGEAIYDTEKLQQHYKQGNDIRYTKKKGEPVYYGLLMKAPQETVNFKYVKPGPNSDIYLLGYEKPLKWSFEQKEGVKINIPDEVLDSPQFQRDLVFKINGKEIE